MTFQEDEAPHRSRSATVVPRTVRWALGCCYRDDVGDGTGGSVDKLLVYYP
jgi:hypothetical protein